MSEGRTLHVIQGEQAIADSPDVLLTTVLGSCVSACLYDLDRRIGGMNHFLLPGGEGSAAGDLRYAAAAMERLINGLLKQGASRSRLQGKLFGGARMMAGLPDIGRRNGEAALDLLTAERIPCVSKSLGGTAARRIRFWPATGRAQQLLLGPDTRDPVVAAPARVAAIELF